MVSNKEKLPATKVDIIKNENIKYPGDIMIQEMKPCGDIVTKLNTKERRATLRQYMKKNGKPGKKTIVIMETEE